MFSRKTSCKMCNRKINKDFEFCPHCGYNLRREQDERNYGLLGKDDSLNFDNFFKMPLGFNTLFNSLLNQIDKEFKQIDKQIATECKEEITNKKIKRFKPASGISISISTSSGKEPEIKIRGFGKEAEQLREAKIPISEITEEQAKQLAKLPKKEAQTKVRRLTNKLVYEIDLPGVKDIKDIIINKLENSIEIKAFSKATAYFKLIPLNLPILNYKLDKEKLILELKP